MRAELKDIIARLERDGRFHMETRYLQHGTVTVYEHSVRVADMSLTISRRLSLRVDEESLIRGALLHDYFLYDWHEKDVSHRLHGFRHPRRALLNAREDYTLNMVEEDIILRHMFPLTLQPPAYKESWIVCLADKYCAAGETLHALAGRFKGKLNHSFGA
ncbi:MAG: HD domain-containing protein [Lachnospiraceae bacterium]|nr:HD domain-containing protein [Lachnospiraceae bacterium]